MLTIDGSMGEGGERWQATFHPAASFERLELLERGGVQRRSATAISRKCQGRWLCASSTRLHALSTGKGPGVAPRWSRTHTGQAMLSSRFVESEHVTEVFTEFGERGVRAEAIAEAVAKEVTRYLAAGVPVGEHLADQLLVPMVLGQGGIFRTLAPSAHCTPQVALAALFLGVHIRSTEEASGVWRIEVPTTERSPRLQISS